MTMFGKLPNIRPADYTTPRMRKLILHPLMFVVCASAVTFLYFFFFALRYPSLGGAEQFLLTIIWAAIAFGGIYLFGGAPLNFLMSRNVPLVFSCFLCFFALCLAEALVAIIFFYDVKSVSTFTRHLISTTSVFAIMLTITTLFFESRLRVVFGYDPEQVPIWWPLERKVDLLQSLLPPERKGKVLMLRSANQYVEVTTEKGTHDLRTTLKSLLESIPKDDGIHLHRSIWIHKDQIKEFGYFNGNPCVFDLMGNVVPVSRNKIDEVKAFIADL